MIPIDPMLLALAGAGLATDRTLPREGWEERLDDVFGHGLAGLLAWAHAADLVDLDDNGTERVRNRLQAEVIRAVQLEGELIRLEQLLADLPAVILKGPVLAHGAYPDPMLRPFTDLDVLVAGRDLGNAIVELDALGYTRSRPEPAPGFDARVGKALALTHPGGVVIDLHRTLVAGTLGDSIDVDELIAQRRSIVIAGASIPGPAWEAHFIEVCLHAVVGDGLARSLSIRDVAQVALHPALDADRAVDLVRRWKVREPVADALRVAVNSFGIDVAGPLRALVPGTRGGRPPLPAPVRSARSRLAELRHGDLRRRVTLTRALVAPSPAFLRWAYGDRPAPELYGRRWLALYRRALEARAGSSTSRGAPPTRPALPVLPSALHTPPGPAPAEDPVIPQPARARYQPFHPVERPRPPGSELSAAAVAVHPRQQQWSDARPRRSNGNGNGSHANPAPPPVRGLVNGAGSPPPVDESGSAWPADPGDEPDGDRVPPSVLPAVSGLRFFCGGVGLLLVTMIGAQLGNTVIGLFLVPAAAILFACAAARRITRLRPDEEWVGRWLVLAVAIKLSASYLRYLTLVVSYQGDGDATDYDTIGRKFAAAWMGNGHEPHLIPDNLRKTNFVRWFTGVVYYLFGTNMILGFFVFGLLALVGSYLWYRATVEAVPRIDKRLYLALVLFVPSIAFWPSSIGKEALMQLGIGALALATAFLFRQRLLHAAVIGLAGGWLVWVVRPHLLALVTLATGIAYLAGRVRRKTADVKFMLGRTLGLLLVAFLVIFSVGQAMQFLGMKDLSLTSVEQSLEEQTKSTSQGESEFDTGGSYLSPVNLPRGFATVLLRPFPWETTSPFQLLASLESLLITLLLVYRFSSIRESLVRARTHPFLLYCWVLTIGYSATFAAFANFGLLVRQRSLVLPALFVLIAVKPALDRRPVDPLRPDPRPEVLPRV